MAAGDIETYTTLFDAAAIDTVLTGNVVVADKIVPIIKGNTVIFVVVKAA